MGHPTSTPQTCATRPLGTREDFCFSTCGTLDAKTEEKAHSQVKKDATLKGGATQARQEQGEHANVSVLVGGRAKAQPRWAVLLGGSSRKGAARGQIGAAAITTERNEVETALSVMADQGIANRPNPRTVERQRALRHPRVSIVGLRWHGANGILRSSWQPQARERRIYTPPAQA